MADRGRPTKYDPKYCEEIIEYFSVKPYEEKVRTQVVKGRKIETIELEANDFPSMAGFCSRIGICRETLRLWRAANPDFMVAYKRAKELQENFTIINGNKGLLSNSFGIFTAKNVLGWRDKQPDEVDQTTVNNYSTLSDEEIQKKIDEHMERKKGG